MKPNQYLASRLVLLLFASIITVNMFAQAGFKEVVERVSPSVVTIYTYDSKGEEIGQGSGFFVRNAGNVVTNRHVIEKAHRAHVNTANGQQFEITHVLAEDKDSDIIVAKICIQPDIAKPARLQTQLPSVGDKIMAFGSPHGYEGSVSDGIISGIRDVEGFGQVFQVTAPVSSGSSGGPLVNLEGEVIGIITFQHIDGQNLNFAMPSQRLASLFSSLVLEESETLSAWSERTQRNTTDELYRKGSLFFITAEYPAALLYLEKVVSLNPEHSSAYSTIGSCYRNLGYDQYAIGAYSRAIELDPSNASNYFGRGFSKSMLNDHYGAIEDFSKAIDLDPNDSLNYLMRGSIKIDINDYYGAIADYTKAIELDPWNPMGYFSRGIIRTHLNKHYGAIADYTKAIQLNPMDGTYYYYRSIDKGLLGDFTGACSDLRRAIDLGYEQAIKWFNNYCR